MATPLDVIGFLTSRQKDGSTYAVMAFDTGKEKEEHVKQLQRFKPVEKSALPAGIVTLGPHLAAL